MFSQSGRLVKKKKTTVKVDTKDPVFNETLNFEVKIQGISRFDNISFSQVAPGQLENSRFLVTLCNRRQPVDNMVMEDAMEGINQDSSDQEAIGPLGSSFER